MVFLPIKSGLIDKFDEPLYNWKNIVHIQALQLEGLKSIWTFHVDEGIADVFGNFDFLTYLHFVIVLDLDFKVR